MMFLRAHSGNFPRTETLPGSSAWGPRAIGVGGAQSRTERL